MAAIRLDAQICPKPWGRRDLRPWSTAVTAEPVGEMIYGDPGDDAPLLVKALFTAQKLSVQVHPDTGAARARGHKHGKDEAWVILAAEPGSTIGLGLRHAVSRDQLAAAAADGSIEGLLDWKPARAGDVFFAPAGTIHAIGAGLTLVEVQQNLDLTYRLFDYGRPRPLHLSDAVEVAEPGPWRRLHGPRALGGGRLSLVEGPTFCVERVSVAGPSRLAPPAGRPAWLTLLSGSGRIDGQACAAGEVWYAAGAARLDFAGEMLLAYPGAGIAPAMFGSDERAAA